MTDKHCKPKRGAKARAPKTIISHLPLTLPDLQHGMTDEQFNWIVARLNPKAFTVAPSGDRTAA